jgi:hypothetical protein
LVARNAAVFAASVKAGESVREDPPGEDPAGSDKLDQITS